MNISLYVELVPGADRPYVSSHPPDEARLSYLRNYYPGFKVYRADVCVPGYDKVDGVIVAVAEEHPVG